MPPRRRPRSPSSAQIGHHAGTAPAPCRRCSRLHAGTAPGTMQALLPAALTRRMHRRPIWRQRGKEIGQKRQNAGRVDTQNAQNGDLASTRQQRLSVATGRRGITAAPRKRHRPSPEAPPPPGSAIGRHGQKSYFSATLPAKTEKLRRKSAKTSLSFSRLLNAGAGFTMFGT